MQWFFLIVTCLVYTVSSKAQIFERSAKTLYIFTPDSETGDTKVFSVDMSNDLSDEFDIEFFTFFKARKMDVEMVIAKSHMLIKNCRKKSCEIELSYLYPDSLPMVNKKIYSLKDHKQYGQVMDYTFGVMSATHWKKYSEENNLSNLPVEQLTIGMSCRDKIPYCYRYMVKNITN